jgi:hypothetical protein
MASQQAADAAALILVKRGFTEVQEINGLAVGARVRSVSEQYSEAYRKGTGTIERIFHKKESSWAQKHQRPDIELIIKRDYPPSDPDDAYRFLADYHVALIEAAPEEDAR